MECTDVKSEEVVEGGRTMVISFVLLDSGQYGMMSESSVRSDHDRLYWMILSILALLAHCMDCMDTV